MNKHIWALRNICTLYSIQYKHLFSKKQLWMENKRAVHCVLTLRMVCTMYKACVLIKKKKQSCGHKACGLYEANKKFLCF